MQIPEFSQANVLIVGDLMLDRYWSGATQRISPEAPVPVVRVDNHSERPGGAGNVATNLVALGARCCLIGLVGRDEAGETLKDVLAEHGITCDLIETSAPTITKLRVLSRHQQLIRMDFESGFPEDETNAIKQRFAARLADADVVLLSDYAKGTLHEVGELIQAAHNAAKPVLVDPKGGDFSRYRGATLLTPNLSEFEAVVGACANDDELVTKAEKLRQELELEHLLVTRSEHGMTLISAGGHEHFPARAREVFDVTGAGDTVIAVAAGALAAGCGMVEATRLANLAAGMVVGKLGAANVSKIELELAAQTSLAGGHRVVSEKALLELVAQARAQGERIVMTNGCFDILHAGHVAYLRDARARGDRLIVAVNDDASVRRLKGESRPVVDVQGRMAVLAGLEAVDWVVPFADDTPAALIAKVLPDVLVKGGDYQPQDIAGYEAVTQAGGKVEVLDYHPGHSTSRIVSKVTEDS